MRAGIGPKRGAVCLFTRWQFPFQACEKTSRISFFFEMFEKKTQLGNGRRFHWVMSCDWIVSSQEFIRGRFLSTGNKRASLSPRCHCSCGASFSPSGTFRLTVFHYFKCNCHGLPFCFEVLMYTCISQPPLVRILHNMKILVSLLRRPRVHSHTSGAVPFLLTSSDVISRWNEEFGVSKSFLNMHSTSS